MKEWLSQHWFRLGILIVLLVAILLTAYYYMVEVPNQQAAQQASAQMQQQQQEANAQSQAETLKNEKASCASTAVQTAVQQYQDEYCQYDRSSPQCSNGTYLMANSNNDYTTCLDQYGIAN